MQIVPISSIRLNDNNPRFIRDEKFAGLVRSVQSFPDMLNKRPIVVNKEMVVLGGNMRLRACIEAGLTEVPIIIADWSEAQQREFIIKDNVSGGQWDWDELSSDWDTALLQDWGLDIPDLYNDKQFGEDFELKDGDRAPFQQMTFTFSDTQAELIRQAMRDVVVMDEGTDGNENSHGNQIHQIVLEWVEQKKLS